MPINELPRVIQSILSMVTEVVEGVNNRKGCDLKVDMVRLTLTVEGITYRLHSSLNGIAHYTHSAPPEVAHP
jgi:hypothetical protein